MDDIYKRLRQWLHNLSPNGFRATGKGDELELLQYLFAPEDARLALHLSLDLKSLPAIAGESGISPDATEKILDRLYLKGVIRRHTGAGKEKSYAALAFFPGIVENVLFTSWSDKTLQDLVLRAFKPNWLPSFNDQIGTSRTVPVGHTIPSGSAAAPYQDVVAMIKKAPQPIMVFPCHCRIYKKDRCDAPMEVCLAFGDHAQFYLDTGVIGRRINIAEALEILQTAEDAGLVHQCTNYTDDELSWLCNCCKCCCFNLGVSNKFFPEGTVRNIDSSAYIAEVQAQQCSGCELCVEKCPVHALEMKENISFLKPERCIGCGQCVTQCPAEAIRLIKRAEDKIPRTPKTWRELIDRQHAAQAAK